MRPSFHPRLINDPFSDPGLFIPFLFEKRALMFDLGSLHSLSPKEILKISHVFVTHTHMDHFIGFDRLLRTILGRQKTLHLLGPPGFFKHVEGKLAGYSWNLVDDYKYELILEVSEVHPEEILSKRYVCRTAFRPGAIISRPFAGTLLEEAAFSVEGVLLDHRIPCLGLSLQENFYVNIIKEGLAQLDLPVGPWLTRFKDAVYRGQDPRGEFLVTWKDKGGETIERPFRLGDLITQIATVSPGQKITYITDVIAGRDNCTKILDLAESSDILFIEAAFLDAEQEAATEKYHLTARQAGELAGKANVRDFRIFHFSPRYKHHEKMLFKEAEEAFLRAAQAK
jgi:ribonuclease Z